MVSQSLATMTLSLAAAFLSTTAVAAQLGAMPLRRYRHTSPGNSEPIFGRETDAAPKSAPSVRWRAQRRQRHAGGMRNLQGGDGTFNFEETDGSMSLPGMEIQKRQGGDGTFDFTFMDIDEIVGSMSMSMPSTESEPKDTVSLETDASTSTSMSSTLILASFLAGFSALLVAAAALFIKMRRVHRREVEEEDEDISLESDFVGENEVEDLRIVSFNDDGEFQDVELQAQPRSVRIY